ncbi:hypothetical protein Tsubulata_018589 [Turnera subulata]|uniref:non-specific serine/threonine protein kinase n=1 Tax=Turnera subulata TaxID=218843 RepID=A0A9Q0G4N6_9ROSI|nr:hypothetical protein Tsubulata_018589 [Turnera subulata]
MASDGEASTHKHRRSPSGDEAEKSSKRHKHRHHRHRHHRHHRSKRHEEKSEQAGEEVAAAAVTPPPPPPEVAAAIGNGAVDDDVEEGEILDEEIGKGDSRNLGTNADNGSPKAFSSELGDELVSPGDAVALENGNLDSEYHRDRKRHHKDSGTPARGSHKQKSSQDVDRTSGHENKIRNSSPSESGKMGPLHLDGLHEDLSRSPEVGRERSRSRSTIEDKSVLERRRHKERNGEGSNEERIIRSSRDVRHRSRDLGEDVSREYSNSYSRHSREVDRDGSVDARDRERSRERYLDRDENRERRDRSMERERRREKERERLKEERDRDRRREKEWEKSRDKWMDMDQRKEKERERSRDADRRLEREQDRGRDREVDAGRRRGKERERSWDREDELDRRKLRERSIEKGRHRSSERDRDRERENDSGKYREREKDSHGYRERERVRDNDREREREKDRDRYRERDRVGDYDRESDRERLKNKNRDNDKDIKSDSAKVHSSNSDSSEWDKDKLRDEDDQDDFEERIALKLAQQEEEDVDKIKEESRKRMQAILEKYRNKQLQQQSETHSGEVNRDVEPGKGTGQPLPAAKADPKIIDSTVDADVAETSFSVGKSPRQNGREASERASGAAGLGEGTPQSERSEEKYCDDIFGETPTLVRKTGKGDGLPVIRSALNDNWDDPEGYYSYRFGELLDGRYEIIAAHGKGVFSTVVRAKDLKAGFGEPEEVAIKIIRNNETMRKAGDLEVSILKKLVGADLENKRHCVRFLSSFKYRNHLCLVFESLHMNLREVLKKFGRNIGLKLTAVRAYAKQLFIALKHLRNCGVLHSDIKPDNMLVNEAKNVLKLCDFGNAMFSGKNEITPYLVSRFYRAPEIILGLQYDHPMDMWSVGCCLYELYTGKVLFPGATNNDMLRLHMELKGPFPKKMLKKGAFVDLHFDHDLNFHATEEDPVTKKSIKRMIVNMKPKDIGSIISGSPGEDPKMLANFKDLLEKVFILDPDKRITVHQALAHPFITGK